MNWLQMNIIYNYQNTCVIWSFVNKNELNCTNIDLIENADDQYLYGIVNVLAGGFSSISRHISQVPPRFWTFKWGTKEHNWTLGGKFGYPTGNVTTKWTTIPCHSLLSVPWIFPCLILIIIIIDY